MNWVKIVVHAMTYGGDILPSHNKYCHSFYDGLMIQSTHNLVRGHHVQTLLLR